MPELDEIDKKIINTIQTGFPIDERPFQILANQLDLDEDELIERIRRMKSDKLIRRIGGNFSPDKLGYFSTLCAARVPEDKITLFKDTVNAYPGVTHNYMREHSFNVWFTFIAPSVKQIENSLTQISKDTGVQTILNLPATRVFKISANFKV